MVDVNVNAHVFCSDRTSLTVLIFLLNSSGVLDTQDVVVHRIVKLDLLY